MSHVVLDASVAVSTVFDDCMSDAAVRAVSGVEPCVPEVFWGEVTRVAARKVAEYAASREDALAAVALLRRLVVRSVSVRPLAELALEISLDLGHPAIDCFYLATAIREEALLLTSDRRLCAKARRAGLGELVHLVE